VAITEMSVPIALHAGPAQLQHQADTYASAVRTCVTASNCTAFAVWGFTDRYPMLAASVPPGQGEPAMLDDSYRPKPAYDRIAAELGGSRPLARNTLVRGS
jgi:endo-1,4-beta-xylanase